MRQQIVLVTYIWGLYLMAKKNILIELAYKSGLDTKKRVILINETTNRVLLKKLHLIIAYLVRY